MNEVETLVMRFSEQTATEGFAKLLHEYLVLLEQDGYNGEVARHQPRVMARLVSRLTLRQNSNCPSLNTITPGNSADLERIMAFGLAVISEVQPSPDLNLRPANYIKLVERWNSTQ